MVVERGRAYWSKDYAGSGTNAWVKIYKGNTN